MRGLRDSKRKRGAILLGLFRALGLSLDISSFEARKKIQKIVFLMKHYLGMERFLPYDYNLYFGGPYSSELADVYYYIEENMDALEILDIEVDPGFRKFVEEVLEYSNRDLELISTLILIMRRASIEDEEYFIKSIKAIKPHFKKREIREKLQLIKSWQEKYKLVI